MLKYLYASFVLATFLIPAYASADEPIVPKDKPIKLFNGKNLDGFYTFLHDSKYKDPKEVFTVKDGILVVSGEELGSLNTKNRYADYHMVIEFRWGKRTWASRTKRTKDSGVLIHCFGPDNAYGGHWMSCIEGQLIQGGCGDFIIVQGNKPEGGRAYIEAKAHASKDRDGEWIWNPEGPLETFNTIVRINNRYRDPDWKDEIGFRGDEDVEKPDGEWNTMEVICKGSRITVKLNGVVVNEIVESSRSDGKLSLQSEFAETHVRRWELLPLGREDDSAAGELHEVSGMITLDGKPLAGATVTLDPVGRGRKFVGNTNKEGRFKITGAGGNKGVAPGRYIVRITPRQVVPARYNAASGLTVEVAPGSNVFDFELAGQ